MATSTQDGSRGSGCRDWEVALSQPSSLLKRSKPTNCPHVSGLELGGDGSLAATGHSVSNATLASSSKPWVPPTRSEVPPDTGQRKG